MEFTEKTLTSELVYKGKIIDVLRDDVEIATGKKSVREVVEHSGGVVILAVKNNPSLERESKSLISGRGSEPSILMVKQFRYPIKQTALELPAGKLEKDEDPFLAAKRELSEETGYEAKTWESLGYIFTSPGFCDEKLYLYKATDLICGNAHPDDGEIIEAYEYKISEVEAMIKNGEINDAKTICAIMRGLKL